MSKESNINFTHESLEKDLARLAVEVQEKRALSENKNLSERDLVKVSLQSLTPQITPSDKLAVTQDEEQKDFLSSYLSKELPPEAKLQIEQLLDLTFHKGVAKAVEEARKAPPFILDAFHDALVDKLYPLLQEKDLLKS